MTGANSATNETFCAGCWLESAVSQCSWSGDPEASDHSSGETRREEGALLRSSLLSGEAALQLSVRESEGLPCRSAGYFGTVVRAPNLAQHSGVWAVQLRSPGGGFVALVPYEVASLWVGGGTQTSLLEGCALHGDLGASVPC